MIYIGASVRLYQNTSRTGAAKTPWFFALTGPMTVFKKGPTTPDSSFYESNPPVTAAKASTTAPVKKTPPPSVHAIPVTARAYVVGNVATGKIYFESNASTALSVASISKLITAFVAIDTIPLETVITITPEQAALSPDKSNLLAGEQFTAETLLLPLLLSSSNVAAEALASSIDRTKFLDLMSSYAWEVGMPSTFFADASGLSPQNVASARDIFALAKYLYTYRQNVLAITRTLHTELATTTLHGFHVIDSTHPLAIEPGFIGGKTGRTTEAGETMITIIKVNDEPIALIVLGSRYGERERDTRILLEKVEKILR